MQRDTLVPLRRIASDASAIVSLRDRAGGIVAFTMVLALLYFGRDVLIPFTVALMLSLLIAPLVRALRRIGLGQIPSVLAAVLTFAVLITATSAVLGTQVLRMAASLPQYEKTIRQKLQSLDDLTVGRLNALTSEAGRLVGSHDAGTASALPLQTTGRPDYSQAVSPIPVELREPSPNGLQIIRRALASVWLPIESTGIALLVLVFVLLEHDELRDRFIRVAGGGNIRLMTLALNDASERLSRFFVSQFAVNVGVGAAIALGLSAIGLPNAILLGALAGLLRFVPYVGVWLAALLATALALAVTPGWSLVLSTLGLFILVEFVVSQAVEPYLYGHTTGLSPLSVVVAAIFWSSLWGPIGLILSTPLTLCCLVLGRHIKPLGFLELLLGDTQALTLPQRMYQRALSGDADEIIAVARAFLKRNSFAMYCDTVLMPALHLAVLDYELGAISEDQQIQLRGLLVSVVSTLGDTRPTRSRWHRPPSVLDDASAGRMLRQQREQLTGKWQGPLAVPPGSVMLCVGLGSAADTLAAELLVRALRDQRLDARHFSMEDLDAWAQSSQANPAGVAMVYLVSAFPSAERERRDPVVGRLQQMLPGARVVTVFLPGMSNQPESGTHIGNADYAVTSFVEAMQMGPQPDKGATGSPSRSAH